MTQVTVSNQKSYSCLLFTKLATNPEYCDIFE